jgi:hypothetical protein
VRSHGIEHENIFCSFSGLCCLHSLLLSEVFRLNDLAAKGVKEELVVAKEDSGEKFESLRWRDLKTKKPAGAGPAGFGKGRNP